MRRAFGKAIMDIAKNDDRIVILHGDVEQEMKEFKANYPNRFFNLGLTEQSMVSIAAGMALQGLRPICYSITPFILERPFEQIKIDIDEQNLPVMLVGYADYPTHGPTHRPLNPEILCDCFKNVGAFFPKSYDEAYNNIMLAYKEAIPAFISLKKDYEKQ